MGSSSKELVINTSDKDEKEVRVGKEGGKEGVKEVNERGEKEAEVQHSGDRESSKRKKMEVEEGEVNEWKTVSGEKTGRSPSSQKLQFGQVTIATPSRFAALRNTDEKGDEIEKELMEEQEEFDNEEADDINQSKAEESVEINKNGRARQLLPRLSKTNHRVVNPETTNHIKDMKRGLRKNH